MKKKSLILTLMVAAALSFNTVTAFAQSTDILNNDRMPLTNTYNSVPNTVGIQSKKLIISEVTTEPKYVEPGKEFTLKFKVENKSSSKLENISLKILGIEGKNILEGFSPLGTTNEIYYGTLNKNSSAEISIKLISSPSIKSGIYNFNVNASFNEVDKSPVEITKICGIIVKNPGNVVLTEFKTSDNGKIDGNFINAGKGSLNSVMVNISAGDVNISKYIGAMEPEVEESFHENLGNFHKDTTGNMVITFKDDMGMDGKIEKTFTIKAAAASTTKPSPEKKWSFKSILMKLFGLGA